MHDDNWVLKFSSRTKVHANFKTISFFGGLRAHTWWYSGITPGRLNDHTKCQWCNQVSHVKTKHPTHWTITLALKNMYSLSGGRGAQWHTWQCSGINYAWWCSGYPMGYRELNLYQLGARQAPYPLYYLLQPPKHALLTLFSEISWHRSWNRSILWKKDGF